MSSLRINEKVVTARKGETILQVARREGIDIPALCYMLEGEPIGSCGLCVVEIT